MPEKPACASVLFAGHGAFGCGRFFGAAPAQEGSSPEFNTDPPFVWGADVIVAVDEFEEFEFIEDDELVLGTVLRGWNIL